MKSKTGSKHTGVRLSLAAIPDRAIGVYFALFPVIVAAFLSLQAVRAHSAELPATTQPAATSVAR